VRYLLALDVAIGLVVGLSAQSSRPAFDVASVKRSPDISLRAINPTPGVTMPGGVWRVRDSWIVNVIRTLYPNHPLPGQVVGGPDWVARDYYDIEARTAPTATADEVRQMGRALLADRFKLALHTESRRVPAYALTLRKDRKVGKGLATPAVNCSAFRAGGARPEDPTRQRNADRLACGLTVMPVFPHTQVVAGADLRLTAGDVTLAEIQTLLGRYMGRPVVDRTGLMQRFDIELQFDAPSGATTAVDDGPSLTTAITEQLGLQLEDERAEIEVLVIDHIERPSEN
jgi:uncharacterized protein (TIGR03435 family)